MHKEACKVDFKGRNICLQKLLQRSQNFAANSKEAGAVKTSI